MCVCCVLKAEITASHFGGGGGLLRKKTSEEEEVKSKTRQELIEELILKSKQEKVKNTQLFAVLKSSKQHKASLCA